MSRRVRKQARAIILKVFLREGVSWILVVIYIDLMMVRH